MNANGEQSANGASQLGRITGLLSGLVLISAILTIWAETAEHQYQTYLLKTVSMILIIAVAGLALDPPSITYKRLIVVGLAVSLIGDVFLMLPADLFLPGLVAFLTGQIIYTIAFVKIGGFYRSFWAALPLIIFGGVVFFILVPDLDDLMIPVLAYLVAILVMVWQAIGQWRQTGETRALYALVGAIFFVISDTALAFNRFSANMANATLIVLGTYYLAQWLIALSAGRDHP